MTAAVQTKRTKTAQQLAAQFGVSERTIRKAIAQPREDYEQEAAQRHERIRELHTQGLSYREIAAEVGLRSAGSVHYALKKTSPNPPGTTRPYAVPSPS
jgi:transposase